ncbi:MAG: hypothetical protein M9920_04610 [Verrucomicrobiae bacterium]|nr:hypothetical protein [Verrucomicrobiae bacterium]
MSSLTPVELHHCQHRDGLRSLPAVSAQADGPIAAANESLRTATKQFGEIEAQGELTKRA